MKIRHRSILGFSLVFVLILFPVSSFGKLDEEDAKIYKEVKKTLEGRGDLIRRSVKRIGNRTIKFEAYIATEMDLKIATKILSDFKEYSRWALKGINIRPSGKPYKLQILDVPVDKNEQSVLNLKYMLKLPLFTHKGQHRFRLTPEQKADYFEIEAVSLPEKKGLIEKASGVAKFFPLKAGINRVWIYAMGHMTLRSWILYEALPDRLLNRMIAHRIKKLVDNCIEEQDRVSEMLLTQPTKHERRTTSQLGKP